MHKQAGEYPEAEAVWKELLARLEVLNLPTWKATTLQNLANNAWMAGQLPEAEAWILETISLRVGLGPGPNLVRAYATLRFTLVRLERRAEAHQALTEGLRLAHQLRATAQVPDLLNALALNLLELDRAQEAVQLCLEALSLHQMDQPATRTDMLDTLALCHAATGELHLARQALAQSMQITGRLDAVPELLHRICTFTVVVRFSLGSPDRSAVLYWLLGHPQANAALKDAVLKELKTEGEPANRLPTLDDSVIPTEVQRVCGYQPGELVLVVPLTINSSSHELVSTQRKPSSVGRVLLALSLSWAWGLWAYHHPACSGVRCLIDRCPDS